MGRSRASRRFFVPHSGWRPRVPDRGWLEDRRLRCGHRKRVWKHQLGTVQKAPPVLADGKIVCRHGERQVLHPRPHSDRVETLSEVDMPISKYSCCSEEGTPEQVLAGAAVSHGRVFFVSSDAVYAIGPKRAKTLSGYAVDEPADKGEGAPAYVQVMPTEMVLKSGQTVKMRARLVRRQGPVFAGGTRHLVAGRFEGQRSMTER